MPLIDPKLIEDTVLDVLFREDEIPPNNAPPDNAVMVEGLTTNFAFHPERLESHRERVVEWIKALPIEFLAAEDGGGGGWSFLNLCMDKNRDVWTGFQKNCEVLYALAAGLGLALILLPREMWHVLPGTVPYIMFSTTTLNKPCV